MFRVTRYPMISKTESGRVGYQKKYRVAGRVRVPAGHWALHALMVIGKSCVALTNSIAGATIIREIQSSRIRTV